MTGYTTGGQNISGQFGMPLYGIGGLPPFTGNYFWVDATNGSDGNTGGPQDPLLTLSAAHTKCLAGNNDVVFFAGTSAITATLVWSKAKTHLIGLSPGAQNAGVAAITGLAGTVFTPLVSVTATDCIFQNVGAFHGFASATTQVCWIDTGGRNRYTGCKIVGMNQATAAAQAGGRSLVVSGATGENYFEECQIGNNTVARSAANASVEFLSASPRNVFRRCVFPIQTSSAAALFINVPAAGLADWNVFEACAYINNLKSAVASTQMTVAVAMASGANGLLLQQRCSLIGATKWGDTNGLLQQYVDGAPPTAATSGIAVNPA